MHNEVLRDLFLIHGRAEKVRHTGHAFVGDTAGDDTIEIAQVGVDVEREAMFGDCADVDFDANGRDFCFAGSSIHPNPGQAGDRSASNTEVGQCPY
jgi:hypothetical protein